MTHSKKAPEQACEYLYIINVHLKKQWSKNGWTNDCAIVFAQESFDLCDHDNRTTAISRERNPIGHFVFFRLINENTPEIIHKLNKDEIICPVSWLSLFLKMVARISAGTVMNNYEWCMCIRMEHNEFTQRDPNKMSDVLSTTSFEGIYLNEDIWIFSLYVTKCLH